MQVQPDYSRGSTGVSGTAIGLGTIVTLLTAAINKWKQFNAEQDRWVDGMIKAEEKARDLGESILAIQDAAISVRRIGTEPLEQSVARLQHEIGVLATEQSLLNLPEQGEEWKKINSEINKNQALLKGVEEALKRQNDAKAKAAQQAAEEAQSIAYGAATPQAKAILENEKAARQYREAGDANAADRLQKTADQFRKSATPADLASLQAVTDAYGKAPELSDIERNKKAFDDYWKQPGMDQATGQAQEPFSVPVTNPPTKEDMTPTPRDTYQAGDKDIGTSGAEIIKAITNLEKTFLSLWR